MELKKATSQPKKCNVDVKETEKGIRITMKGNCDPKKPETYTNQTFNINFEDD